MRLESKPGDRIPASTRSARSWLLVVAWLTAQHRRGGYAATGINTCVWVGFSVDARFDPRHQVPDRPAALDSISDPPL
jgi:hypothetical protein